MSNENVNNAEVNVADAINKPIESVPTETSESAEITEVEDEVIERPYTLRKLKNEDLWTVLRILTILLPDDLKRAFIQVIAGKKTLKEVGRLVVFDMVTLILKNAHKAQEEVDGFCANMIGVTVEELNEMEFGTTPLIITDIVTNTKNISFFKVLSKFVS